MCAYVSPCPSVSFGHCFQFIGYNFKEMEPHPVEGTAIQSDIWGRLRQLSGSQSLLEPIRRTEQMMASFSGVPYT